MTKWWGLLLLLSLVLSACNGGEPGAAADTAEQIDSVGDPVRGRELWETGGGVLNGSGCSQCHSIDGSEQTEFARKLAPSFLGVSGKAGDRVSGLSAEEYLRESILDPAAYVVAGYRNIMPTSLGFKLDEQDVDSLVAFLLTL